jgi:hypothetical protein
MNVAGLERAERPLAARTAVPYWSAYTALEGVFSVPRM